MLIDGRLLSSSQDWNQQLRGRVELAKFAESTPLWDDSGRSLAAITQSVLGIKLCKSKKIRMGNWGAKSLSASQAVYAAMDAWVGSEALSLLEKAVGRRAPSDSSLVTDSKGSRDTKDAKVSARPILHFLIFSHAILYTESAQAPVLLVF